MVPIPRDTHLYPQVRAHGYEDHMLLPSGQREENIWCKLL